MRMRLQLLLLLAGGAGLVGCTVKKPEAPVFSTDLYVPLGVQRTTGLQLIHQNEYIRGDSTGAGPLTFHLTGAVDAFSIGSFLDVDVPPSTSSTSLDAVAVVPPQKIPVSFPLSALAPGVPPTPTDMPLPPFAFNGVRAQTAAQPDFQWLQLQSGTLDLKVHNHLPVPLGPWGANAQALDMRLIDRVTDQVVREISVTSTIAPQDSADLQVDLAGAAFHNLLDVEIAGASPGTNGQVATIDPASSIDLRLSLDGIQADSAVAVIPAQHAVSRQTAALANDIELQQGVVQSGNLTMFVANALPLGGQVRFDFPEIQRGGDPYSVLMNLPNGSNFGPADDSTVMDFTGCTMTAPTGQTLSALHYTVTLDSNGSGGQAVAIGVHQQARGTIAGGTIRFDTLTGIIHGRQVPVTPSTTDFNPPEGIDQLQFQQVALSLVLQNTVGFGAMAHLQVAGFDAQNNPTATIPLDFHIKPGTPGSPVSTTVQVVDSVGNGPHAYPILQLVQGLTRKLTVSGNLAVGGSDSSGTVHRTDTVNGTYVVDAPMKMKIGRILHRSDPFSFTIASSDQDKIRSNVLAATATGTIVNHLPAGVSAHLVFAAVPESLTTHPDVVLDSLVVAPGRIDPATGRVNGATTTPVRLTVKPSDIAFFARDQVYGEVVLTVAGPQADQVVMMTANDYVDVKAILQFQMKVAQP